MRKVTDKQVEGLLDEVTKLTSVIQRKLLDGESTAEPRARRAKIEAQVARLREAAADAKSDASRAFVIQVAESAEEIARTALKFVDDRVLRLKPPKKPGDKK
jgi:hypothetical protein